MPKGMRLVVALTGLGSVLAIGFSVSFIVTEREKLATITASVESGGMVEIPFIAGLVLLVSTVGLIRAQNWARVQVIAIAGLALPLLGILTVAGIALALERAMPWGPTLALVTGPLAAALTCLSVIYYLSFGPGRRAFPTFSSRSSAKGCAIAAASAMGFVAIVVGTLVWNVIDSGLHPDSTDMARARPVSEIERDLAKVFAAVPRAEGSVASPCPDATIKANSPREQTLRWYGHTIVWIWPMLYESPAPFAGPADGWEWVTNPTIRRLIATRGDADAPGHDERRSVGRLRYVAVIRSVEKALPQALSEGDELPPGRKRLKSGVHFRPGTLRGAVFIMDIYSATLICQTPVEVRSGENIEYAVRGTMKSTAQQAVVDDFKHQFLERTRLAVRRISSLVRVSLYD